MRRLLAPAVYAAVNRAMRSRLVARALFGVDFRPIEGGERYFDATTPVLVHHALRRLDSSSRVLDMGTGTVAVVGLALWRKLGCHVLSVDVNPECVRLARANVERNGAPIRVVQSSFFDSIDEDFDTVVFNPPYVPSSVGDERRLPERLRSQWDGGESGVRAIDGFLDALERDRRDAVAIMGVNHRHAPRDRILPLLEARDGLVTEAIERHWLVPVDVYVIGKRRA